MDAYRIHEDSITQKRDINPKRVDSFWILRLVLEEQENQIILKLKEFNKEEKVIKSRLVLYTIARLFGTTKGIEKIHIEDIIKLCGNNIGNKYLTPNKNTKVLIKNNKIYFSKQN